MKLIFFLIVNVCFCSQFYAQSTINNPKIDLNSQPTNLTITKIEFSDKRVEVFYRYKFKRGTKDSKDAICLQSPGKKKSLRIYDNDGQEIASLVSTKNISSDCVWKGTSGDRGQTLDFSASFTPINNLNTNKIDIIEGDIKGKKGNFNMYGVDVTGVRLK